MVSALDDASAVEEPATDMTTTTEGVEDEAVTVA